MQQATPARPFGCSKLKVWGLGEREKEARGDPRMPAAMQTGYEAGHQCQAPNVRWTVRGRTSVPSKSFDIKTVKLSSSPSSAPNVCVEPCATAGAFFCGCACSLSRVSHLIRRCCWADSPATSILAPEHPKPPKEACLRLVARAPVTVSV